MPATPHQDSAVDPDEPEDGFAVSMVIEPSDEVRQLDVLLSRHRSEPTVNDIGTWKLPDGSHLVIRATAVDCGDSG